MERQHAEIVCELDVQTAYFCGRLPLMTETVRSAGRESRFTWRMSEQDRAKLDRDAAAHGLDVTTYLERVVLGKCDAQPRKRGRKPRQHQEALPSV